MDSRWALTRRIVRPVDGKTTQLDLGGTTPVKGRLLVSGKPANATRVELAVHSEHFGPVMAHTTTDSDGRFTFFGPPAGPYTLFYMLPGDRSQFGRIKDVTITDSPSDLGDVAVDVGPVNVTVQADDPADLAKLTYGSVRVDSTDTIYLNNSVALQRAAGQMERTGRRRACPRGRCGRHCRRGKPFVLDAVRTGGWRGGNQCDRSCAAGERAIDVEFPAGAG